MVSYSVEVAESEYFKGVLILIVMDNGLLLRKHGKLQDAFVSS